MRFGFVPLAEAKGAISAHSHRLAGKMIRKGSVLDDAAIAALREAGRTEVVAARLDPGDVPEDICADRLADRFVAPLLARSRAATGRVNLMTEAPGLLRVDAAKIDRINAVNEALTIGTLPDFAVVAARDVNWGIAWPVSPSLCKETSNSPNAPSCATSLARAL